MLYYHLLAIKLSSGIDEQLDLTPDHCFSPHSPVIVSITECSNRNGKWLPNRVKIVLNHLSLMADCEPGTTKLNTVTMMSPLQKETVTYNQNNLCCGHSTGNEVY